MICPTSSSPRLSRIVRRSGVSVAFEQRANAGAHRLRALSPGRHRAWFGSFDRGDVDAVLEVNNSAIALAMNTLCTQKDKVHLNSGAVTADLTGKSCSPNIVHWTYDSWMLTHPSSTALT